MGKHLFILNDPPYGTERSYNGLRLAGATLKGGKVAVCGSCMDARGITEGELAEACLRSTMEELTDWTLWADKLLVF